MLRPAALACTECRKHHLKCDAKKPSCSRCLNTRLDCNYLPSRRGGRRKPRDNRRHDSSPIQADPSTAPAPIVVPGNDVGATTTPFGDSSQAQSLSSAPIEGSLSLSSGVSDARLVRLYYENFHSAHPILVPPSLYDDRKYPSFLHQVVKCIGAQFAGQVDTGPLHESTAVQLSSTLERSPWMVQALLLYSIFLCGRDDSAHAKTTFSRATDIALELGMYTRDFAPTFSTSELDAESLRRTWWELFILEINLASLHTEFTLRCGDVPSDALLPCEESIYASSPRTPIPPSTTLSRFKMRIFTDEDSDDPNHTLGGCKYSSFSYRIDAICILARVLVLNRLPDAHEDHLQAVANALVSWSNHLPLSKVDIVDMYGNVDEMLFQAHTTIHYASMLLHLPRSNLRPDLPSIGFGFSICPSTQFRPSPSLTRHVHDIKATEGSKKLSNLLSVRPSAQGYSPFFAFGMLLCGLVQLGTSKVHSAECLDHHCNRVVLVLGCLKSLKMHWGIGAKAYFHLRRVAGETFAAWVESQGSHVSGPGLPRVAKQGTSTGSGTMGFEESDGLNGEMQNQMQRMFSPRILSAYVDPTCSDPFLLNHMAEFDVL